MSSVGERRVAVVTGASSGIGEALVRRLAGRGWHCVLLARREDRLRPLSAEIGGEYELCDVADRESVEAVAARVLERHPRIHLLVNNAGVAARATFLEGDPAAVEQAIRTNYLGSIWALRAFLPGLEAAAPSDLVNVVSVAGVVALPASGPYAASKHAQLAFSRSVAAQLRERRIRVHTVKPGFVETEGFPQGWLPRPLQRIVLGPDDVAEHVLASLDRGRGESTVPWFYAPLGVLQALMPNVLARVLAAASRRTTIRRG
jgi:NAD(P)-dependent dehydrogenase (short-subunit alcohol dehydrogenase family)